jgi:glycosyltransferase involved in cell wall biosynthesis
MPEVAGDAAILVDPLDQSEFCKALHNLYSDESVRKRLQETGLQQAKKFSWKKYATEVIKAYEQM